METVGSGYYNSKMAIRSYSSSCLDHYVTLLFKTFTRIVTIQNSEFPLTSEVSTERKRKALGA